MAPPDLDPEPAKSFGYFTQDLQEMADWLFVVNAQGTQNLPGRKTDIPGMSMAAEIARLRLLRNSFRPEEAMVVLRTYWRQVARC